MLKLSTKCWISAFNAQGSRGIAVAVQVGAVKIYVAAVEALRKKQKDRVKLRKLMVSWVSTPPLNAIVRFCRFSFESHPVYDQTSWGGLEQDVNPVNSQYQNNNTLAYVSFHIEKMNH
jgi:hypothetical protein